MCFEIALPKVSQSISSIISSCKFRCFVLTGENLFTAPPPLFLPPLFPLLTVEVKEGGKGRRSRVELLGVFRSGGVSSF